MIMTTMTRIPLYKAQACIPRPTLRVASCRHEPDVTLNTSVLVGDGHVDHDHDDRSNEPVYWLCLVSNILTKSRMYSQRFSLFCHNLGQFCHDLGQIFFDLDKFCYNLGKFCHDLEFCCYNLETILPGLPSNVIVASNHQDLVLSPWDCTEILPGQK